MDVNQSAAADTGLVVWAAVTLRVTLGDMVAVLVVLVAKEGAGRWHVAVVDLVREEIAEADMETAEAVSRVAGNLAETVTDEAIVRATEITAVEDFRRADGPVVKVSAKVDSTVLDQDVSDPRPASDRVDAEAVTDKAAETGSSVEATFCSVDLAVDSTDLDSAETAGQADRVIGVMVPEMEMDMMAMTMVLVVDTEMVHQEKCRKEVEMLVAHVTVAVITMMIGVRTMIGMETATGMMTVIGACNGAMVIMMMIWTENGSGTIAQKVRWYR